LTHTPDLTAASTPGYGGHNNRGLALLDDRVFVSTGDCRLVAVDRKLGTQVWESQVCNPDDQYTITAAPRAGAGSQ
jgi:outer membrane protein assembly factor BamB